MHLKRLELSGFKSFAQKTVLEFPRGISAIVGPNGSGKSNVTDAIRWALGEQSLKNIRTVKSEELIFSGTKAKPAASLASVNLLLDNEDNFFNLDFSEISISRKVYRDGQGEYFLNKEGVRLKDIVEFLARAHLGVRGFNVISQGAVDAILAASLIERREILEEALGLREYQLKKKESERKLVQAKSNLDKISSLLLEIGPHLRYLKRQASRYEKRAAYEQELKILETQYFSGKLSEILGKFAEYDGQKDLQMVQVVKVQNELGALEKKLKEAEGEVSESDNSEIVQIEEELKRVQDLRTSSLKEIGRIEGIIEANSNPEIQTAVYRKFSQSQFKIDESLQRKLTKIYQKLRAFLNIQSLPQEIKNGLSEMLKEIGELIGLISVGEEVKAEPKIVDAKVGAFKKIEEELKEKIESLDDELKNFNLRLAALRSKTDVKFKAARELIKSIEAKRLEVQKLQDVLRFWEIEKEKYKLKEDDLKLRIQEVSLFYEDLKRYIASEDFGKNPQLQENLEQTIAKSRRELGEIGTIDLELLKEYQETSGRHEFLTGQKQDLEKASADLYQLIKELNEKLNSEFDEGVNKTSEAFNNYFKMMFDGGSAKLKVTSFGRAKQSAQDSEAEVAAEEAVEEEVAKGLEISVDLPRKRIKSLEMLSGGERALTSIALLFGIIAASPPPFLILDEIDAALDETNSLRFSKMLKELSEQTQFILVTHNRSTMAAADVLYGVTMGEDGVSKLLSLKLES